MSAILGGSQYARLFAQTASVTVVNTVTESTLLSTGVGSLTLPANFFTVGKTVKFLATGVHSAASTPQIRIRAYLGATLILDTTSVPSSSSTNAVWEARGFITCRTVGATGTVFAQGFYEEDSAGQSPFGMANTAPITIDTTAAQTVDITATWGASATGNSLTCTNFILEGIG